MAETQLLNAKINIKQSIDSHSHSTDETISRHIQILNDALHVVELEQSEKTIDNTINNSIKNLYNVILKLRSFIRIITNNNNESYNTVKWLKINTYISKKLVDKFKNNSLKIFL